MGYLYQSHATRMFGHYSNPGPTICAFFGWLALKSKPSRIERDAIVVRDQAKRQLEAEAATGGALAPSRLLAAPRPSGVVITALASRYLLRR